MHGIFVHISHSPKTLFLNDYNMVEMSKNVHKFECTLGFEDSAPAPPGGKQANSICRITVDVYDSEITFTTVRSGLRQHHGSVRCEF